MPTDTKTAHTPTPYTCEQRHRPDGEPMTIYDILGGDDRAPVEAAGVAESVAETWDKNNAAFIVHACNAHDALVRTLSEALAWLQEDELSANHDTRPLLAATNERIRAALTLARGEA